MAIHSFKDLDTERFFKKGLRPRKKGWDAVRNIANRKLSMLHYATALKDLKSPPNNRLEGLKGDLKGFYSIRINDQWRVIFRWNQGAYDVQIVDYH